MSADIPLDAVDYAVLDVETTGLSPQGGDRVVEIAVVRHHPDGSLADTWTTLVNPGRDVGATHIHGITADDVRDAPVFADILGDLGARLRGAVLVAHNARFDRGFLHAEYARAEAVLPDLPTLCTMTMLGILRVPGRRSLRAACQQLAVAYDDELAHGALHDAQAAAALLWQLRATAWEQGLRTTRQLGSVAAMPAADAWPAQPPSGRVWRRRSVRAPEQTVLPIWPRAAEA